MSLIVDTCAFILVCSCTFLFATWFLLKHKRYKLPPGPIGFPILGALPYINPEHPGESVLKLSEVYGNIVYGYMGSYRTVFLNDYKTVKKAFSRTDDTFSDRPRTAMFEQFGEGKGAICCFVDNHWKELRRFLLRTLRNFGMGKTMGRFRGAIMREVDYLMDGYAKAIGPIDPESLLSMAVSNIICTFIFANRFDYADKEFRNFIDDMKHILHLSAPGDLTSYFPFMRFVPFSGYNDLAKCSRRIEAGLFKKKIEEHIKNFDVNREPLDMIDCFLEEMERKKSESPNGFPDSTKTAFSYENLMHLVGDTFAGGTDTTSASLLWPIACVTKFTDHQKQLQEEIDRVVGRDRRPALEDKPNLPLLQAFLAEVLRWTVGGAFGVPHAAWKDTKLDGYDIPKGTIVVPNLFALLHDPEVFPDPKTFDPSRFFDNGGKLKLSLLERTNAQFSYGRRSCPGAELAHMQRFTYFSHLIHRFNLIEPSPGSIRLEPLISISASPVPFKIIFEER